MVKETPTPNSSEGEYKPHEQEAALTCVSGDEPEKEIMLTFDVPELEERGEELITSDDPSGIYQATVNGVIFPCERWSGALNRINCIGPLIQNNVMALIRLEYLMTGAVLNEGEVSILIEVEEGEMDHPQACDRLEQVRCTSRYDCKWNVSQFPSQCESR